MTTKGYKPVVRRSREIQYIAEEFEAFQDIALELVAQIDQLAAYTVTEAELKRDFRFTPASIRLLRKGGLLVPIENSGRRSYDLRKAIKIGVLMAGLKNAKKIRTKRKHSNITSVYRDYLNRITEAGGLLMHS